MKAFLLCLFMLYSVGVKAQSVSSIVSNHVFVMCDEKGFPSDLGNGIYVYMVFHDNSTLDMLMGATLSDAIDGGSLNAGTWKSYDSNVSFTWNSTGKGNTWYRDGNSENLKSSDGLIIKNLGGF